MQKAKVKFHMLMEYETVITERKYDDYPEDNMTINESMLYEKDTLAEYRENLASALEDAKLLKITIEETEHFEVPDEVIDYQI